MFQFKCHEAHIKDVFLVPKESSTLSAGNTQCECKNKGADVNNSAVGGVNSAPFIGHITRGVG